MIFATMEDVLKNWNFEDYIEFFQANKIELDLLFDFTFDSLAPLMPIIGDRMRFLKNLDELKKSQVEELGGDLVERGSVVDLDAEIIGNTVDPNISNFVTEETDTPEIGDKGPENSKRRRLAASDFQRTVVSYPDCTEGESIRINYSGPAKKPKTRPFLDVSHQNLLSELIVRNELIDPNSEISPARFVDLANQIKIIFPNEVQGTYFIPYFSIKIDGKVAKKNPAQGKLFYKYNNYCKKLLANGSRTYKKKIKRGEQSASVMPTDTITTLRWLESQLQITDQLKAKWTETSLYRLNKLQREQVDCQTIIKRSGKCLINSYHVKYPFLRQPQGYMLLEQDFIQNFPEKEFTLFRNWRVFRSKVKAITGKDGDISDVGILLDFCSIVTAKQPTKRVTSKWVANSEEISEGFLLHIKVIDSLQTETDRIIKRTATNKLHVSPFAVIFGLDIDNITDSYMYIDGIQFRAGSVLHAIDITFKAVHALLVEYQAQSHSVWLLFQKVMYDLITEWNSELTVVEELLPKFQ